MDIVIGIPARMGSTRFPGKPLCDLAGKPMVQWVVEAARRSGLTDRIVVATPDAEIVEACRAFGAEAVLTRSDHETGTDRLAEAASVLGGDIWVNVQGDEPLMRPETIRACAAPLIEDGSLDMATVYCGCTADEEENPAVVKVVTDLAGNALYFSRYPIPFPRASRAEPLKKHVGIYAYSRRALTLFSTWEPTPVERTEGLEQLRFLEHGVAIRVVKGEGSATAVDTPEQAEQVRRIVGKGGFQT